MEASKFVKEAFTHYKPIAGTNEGKVWIENENMANCLGVFLGCKGDNGFISQFIQGIASHRFWERVLV
jgi:catalase